jgi:hypothetical protein
MPREEKNDRREGYDTHDVMYLWASWYPEAMGAGEEGVDASLVSDTESSTTARAPSPVTAPPLFVGAFFAGPFPADLIRDGSASGDDAAAPVEDAEDVDPCEEPRVLFVPFLLFLLGAAGGAVVAGACCPPVAVCCCLAARFALFAGVDPPCTGVGDGGSAFPRAGVSERLAISSAIVSAVGEAVGAAVVVARGTSTKSAVSDRGDWRGGDVERRAEEERDQTISSSSERESLAHLELEVSERTSREDEREVVVIGNVERSAGDGEMEKSIYLIG